MCNQQRLNEDPTTNHKSGFCTQSGTPEAERRQGKPQQLSRTTGRLGTRPTQCFQPTNAQGGTPLEGCDQRTANQENNAHRRINQDQRPGPATGSQVTECNPHEGDQWKAYSGWTRHQQPTADWLLRPESYPKIGSMRSREKAILNY